MKFQHILFSAAAAAATATALPSDCYYNNETAKFYVNGTTIPDVGFDVGPSYAGLIPISRAANETRKLYFWFFPRSHQSHHHYDDDDDNGKCDDDDRNNNNNNSNSSSSSSNINKCDNDDDDNDDYDKCDDYGGGSGDGEDLVIWLNGGPGCSSLEGLMQENGPFLWQYGTFRPVRNPYAWNKLADVVWVEQPVGTGFSQGTPNLRNEGDMARQFLGFLEEFLGRFGMRGRRVYVAGESYAGYYVPYIVDAMYARNNTDLFNPKGLMLYDPSLSHDVVQQQIPAVPYVEAYAPLFGLNASTMAELRKLHVSCGYADFLKYNLVFPPRGPLPTPPQLNTTSTCNLWSKIVDATKRVNPCFNVYLITTLCPQLWDVLGFSGSTPHGTEVYFNRASVRSAIHAPSLPRNGWVECTPRNVFPNSDASTPSTLSVLPRLIERNERTMITHGALDYLLMANGTLLAIQNMTWGGVQGLRERPWQPFVVEKRGTIGSMVTERGLTVVEVGLSGHMVPQYAPHAAYRQLKFLLGRVERLSSE